MDRFYSHCIFCGEELPSDIKGEGEHVIPKNIYGFWRSYEICEKCKKYFGDNIDQISLQNVKILNAMNKLNLSNADKLFEHLPYVGYDTIDKSKILMIKKDGEFKIKATVKGRNSIKGSENDWDNFHARWLENIVRDKISKEKFDKEIENLKVKYDALKPGETVNSDTLECSVSKRQIHKVKINYQALPPISKLIAKIGIFFLRLVLSPQQIRLVPAYEMLVKHARFDEDLKRPMINWCPLAPKIEYHKFHKIVIYSFKNVQMVDVTLFGYPNWRMGWSSTAPIILKDGEGKKLREIWLILDFKDLEKREKYIGFKYVGESHLRYCKI